MGRFLRATVVVALSFVGIPALVVLVASFSAEKVIAFPPPSFSLGSYGKLLSDPQTRAALGRSLIVGLEAVLFSIVVGVPAALALFRHRVRFKVPIAAFLMLGVSIPLVASGFAFLVLYTEIGLIGQLWPVSLAISAVNLPFLLFSLGSTLTQLDPDLEPAAETLGADRVQVFLFVTLPGLMPGILSGSILVFVLGITEFLVSLLITTVSNQTLPVVIFGSLRGAVPPTLAAAAGLYMIISLLVVIVITNVRATGAFLYRRD